MKTGNRQRIPEHHRDYARAMRADWTKAENILWQSLRNKQLDGFKFKRQVPIGSYIVDLVCFESQLIVEVDGSQHVENDYDKMRDAALTAGGFRVLRFWNDEIVRNIDGACKHILLELKNTGE
jgi:very-short-patch-repair endonuclease